MQNLRYEATLGGGGVSSPCGAAKSSMTEEIGMMAMHIHQDGWMAEYHHHQHHRDRICPAAASARPPTRWGSS